VKLGDLPFLMPPAEYRPTRWMHRALKDVGVEPRNIVARSQFPDVISNMAIEGKGAAVLFDHFAIQGVAEGKLVRIGPPMPSTQRVLLIGPRAKRPAAQPAVEMFRQATRSLGTGPAISKRQA
jgi:DNA-binding transcriptional LysR family regulator